MEGAYFIDRDPVIFSRIVAALRSGGPIDHDGLSSEQERQLGIELDYFLLPHEIGSVGNSHMSIMYGAGLIGNGSGSRFGMTEQACRNSFSRESCLDVLNGQLGHLENCIREVDERFEALEETERKLEKVIEHVDRNKTAAKTKVSFNVRGRLFAARSETFLQYKNSYFNALLDSGAWKPDKGGAYFVDRDPALFSRIMASLRATRSYVDSDGLSRKQIMWLRDELDYYQLPLKICTQLSQNKWSIKNRALARAFQS